MRQKNNNKASIILGIIAPILFVVIFTSAGFYRENYSSMRNFISELSIGNEGWMQICNFMVFGLLLFIFSLDVLKEFRRRGISKTGPIILLIIAISYFFSGPFVTDPGTIFTHQKSIHGIIHGLFGAVVFTLMPITCWVFLKQFKRQQDYKTLKFPTYFFAITITIAVLLFSFITKVTTYNKTFDTVFGFVQRLVLIPFMFWLSYFAFVFKKSFKS